jgi:hypothetical protein
MLGITNEQHYVAKDVGISKELRKLGTLRHAP